jgi:hypothetical protein
LQRVAEVAAKSGGRLLYRPHARASLGVAGDGLSSMRRCIGSQQMTYESGPELEASNLSIKSRAWAPEHGPFEASRRPRRAPSPSPPALLSPEPRAPSPSRRVTRLWFGRVSADGGRLRLHHKSMKHTPRMRMGMSAWRPRPKRSR